jgi:hypothetical protein
MYLKKYIDYCQEQGLVLRFVDMLVAFGLSTKILV